MRLSWAAGRDDLLAEIVIKARLYVDEWVVSGRLVALPEVFPSRLVPHRPEGLALFPACGMMEDEGACAGLSGLFGLGCLMITRRFVLGPEY